MEFLRFFHVNIFVFEFILSFIPFIPMIKGRKYWWAIFLLFAAALVVYSQFTFLRIGFADIWINSLWYVSTFVIMVAAVWVCKRDVSAWKEAIFVATSAYTIQNIFYKVKTIKDEAFAAMGVHAEWANYVLYWFLIIAVYGVMYYVYVRPIVRQKYFKIDNLFLLFAMVVSLFVIVAVNTYFYRFMLFTGHLNKLPAFMADLLGLICCLLIIHALKNNIYSKKKEEDLRIIQLLWENDKKQYELFRQNLETMNIKYHDLKHQLRLLSGGQGGNQGGGSAAWLKEAEASLDTLGMLQKTGNKALDVLLVETNIRCKAEGIQMSVMADGGLLEKMNEVDVYSLFGNAFDNAIECLKGVDDAEKRFLSVQIRRVGEMAKIQIENFVPNEVAFVNGLPQTTKPDRRNHGFGVRSISLIVEKYGGILSCDAHDNVFTLDIMLPI